MTKRILIITYYWPPSGGSGVQRWLKFAKYLAKSGWEPFVFTPENPYFALQDHSLSKDVPPQVEVIRFPIWEPYQVFNRIASFFSGKKLHHVDFVATGKRDWLQNIGMWVRGNFFIPDARKFWIKPSVEFLLDFVQRNNIDKIITTGPPHSVHLIGRGLKKRNSALKWVADFRDPWSQWDLLDTLKLSDWARKRHEILERAVLREADLVLTVTPYYVKEFKKLGGKDVRLITNGFDEDDFTAIDHQRTKKFTVRHIGGVDELRDPRPAMEALKQLCLTDHEFSQAICIEFVGAVNKTFKTYVENDPVLATRVTFVSQIPHSKLLTLYGSTDALLLVLAHAAHASGNIPGKLFEYMASGNAIIGIGVADGDSAAILRQSGAGAVYDPTDTEGVMQAFQNCYANWKAGVKPPASALAAYSRRALTEHLIQLLAAL